LRECASGVVVQFGGELGFWRGEGCAGGDGASVWDDYLDDGGAGVGDEWESDHGVVGAECECAAAGVPELWFEFGVFQHERPVVLDAEWRAERVDSEHGERDGDGERSGQRDWDSGFELQQLHDREFERVRHVSGDPGRGYDLFVWAVGDELRVWERYGDLVR
jgi:hypothetical protein